MTILRYDYAMVTHFRQYYEQAFNLAFLSKRGTQFEDWFAEIMELRYPDDFVRVRPWGRFGDRKNDGYLRSERTMFQVYAPNELKDRETLSKLSEDFASALPHWREYFDSWVFVHNSKDGLSPKVNQRLLELNSKEVFFVTQWGYAKLRDEVFQLSQTDLQSLFGPVPTFADLYNVQFQNFANVLQYIAKRRPSDDADLRPIPYGKLDANGLSDDSKHFIFLGKRKSDYAGEFFDQYHNPEYGDQVSSSFAHEYSKLKNLGLPPDDIFSQLLIFTGLHMVTDSSDKMAVYALVAYFFEVCDIFEAPLRA